MGEVSARASIHKRWKVFPAMGEKSFPSAYPEGSGQQPNPFPVTRLVRDCLRYYFFAAFREKKKHGEDPRESHAPTAEHSNRASVHLPTSETSLFRPGFKLGPPRCEV